MNIEIDKEKTEEHWLEVVVKEGGEVWAVAQLKWDGCVHYRKYMNHPRGSKVNGADSDYLHICSLREFIEQLQEMERLALAHFADRDVQYWPTPPGVED